MLNTHFRAVSPADVDSLVGQHVIGETPEVYWEDSHGHFQFATEAEALQALRDPYYQQFLPAVDWSTTVIRKVSVYRPYSANSNATWLLMERATAAYGPASMWREQGRWHVSFGRGAAGVARTPALAICIGSLYAAGIPVEVFVDRIDSQLAERAAIAESLVPEGQSLL